ncbi:phosphomannomutase/phosphoglucomutase [Candidatus Parcubacteria bacterium]|nr:phosphomannomutase/phosphoglucomutase [Candidatus Parcubacteria bacterium]
MAVNLSIFHAYDIRGKYPDELDEDAAGEIGRAVSEMTRQFEPGPVLVARDGRVSSLQIASAVVRGLVAGGSRVVDMGVTTTPLLYFIAARHEVSAGVMVTASHSPPEYNGLKFVRRGGVSFPEFGGLDELRQLLTRGLPEPRGGGAIETADYSDEYVAFLVEHAPAGRFHVAVDAGNGAAGVILPKLLDRLPGIAVERLNFELDGSFPGRGPNPLKEGALNELQGVVREKNCQLGVAFDGDGDRALFVDESGATIHPDFITALLGRAQLAGQKGAIVYDIRSSKIVPETIRLAGGEPIVSPIGYTFIKQAAREHNAVFGGERSGHYYFPEMQYIDSGLFAFLQMLKALAQAGKSLSELIRPLQKYVQSGELNFGVVQPDAVIEAIAAKYADGRQSRLDGLTVEYDDWWFNIRKSNTEPVVRLNIETVDSVLLDRYQQELAALINKGGV